MIRYLRTPNTRGRRIAIRVLMVGGSRRPERGPIAWLRHRGLDFLRPTL